MKLHCCRRKLEEARLPGWTSFTDDTSCWLPGSVSPALFVWLLTDGWFVLREKSIGYFVIVLLITNIRSVWL
jgi:hypothetical protein